MVETWIDTRTGDLLVGQAAINERLDEAGPAIVPLIDAVLDESIVEPISPERRVSIADMSNQEVINYGKWALRLMEQAPVPTRLGARQLKRLGELGAGPPYHSIYHLYGRSLWRFREAAGGESFKSLNKYKDWSTADYVISASQLADSIGRKPRQADYNAWARAGNGPTVRVIRESILISELNELIGYPNIASWDKEDYLTWGVRVMKANHGEPLGKALVTALSKRKRGPSAKTIYNYFPSLLDFQSMVEREYEIANVEAANAEAIKDQEYAELTYRLPPELSLELADVRDQRAFLAKYKVASMCLKDASQRQKVNLAKRSSASFINGLRNCDDRLAAGDIELAASILNVFDDIWNLEDNWREYLYVPEEEQRLYRSKRRRTAA